MRRHRYHRHRFFRAAAKLMLAAFSIGLLAAYSAGITPSAAAAYIRDCFKQDEAVEEPVELPEPVGFIFIESPNIFEEKPAEAEAETEPVMNPVKPEYVPKVTNQSSYEVDPSLMERKTVTLDDTDEPQILIVHTHSSEAYATDEILGYVNDSTDRTLDTNFNVVKVGDELAQYLESAGVGVVHDRIINDYPSYNGSYSRMLKIINGYLEKYPTIKMVLDVHRDAIYYRDGTPYAAAAELDGERAAQVMLVVGTDEGGLSHDGWRDNMAFAMKIQCRAETDHPGLMRDINLRKERFNQHTTPGSLIVEVGTTGNTLTEALRGVKYFADALLKVVKP